MEYVKQNTNEIWASAGDIVMPDASKIEEGWLVEVPPRQYWNWMQNRTDTNIAHLFQRGVPEWDNTVEYLNNKSFVVYNGIVYKSIQTGTNKNPQTEVAYWKRAFSDWSQVSDAVSSLTPTANSFVYFTSPTTAAVSTISSFSRNLLAQTTAEQSRTVLSAQAANNKLTAISSAGTSANKLVYFTGTETVGVTDLTSFARNLLGDSTAAGARTTLGLGTVSTEAVTTSDTDSTAGRITKVGDFGIGVNVTTLVSDCNNAIVAGFYSVSGTAANKPVVNSIPGNLIVTTGGAASRCTQYYSQDNLTIPEIWVRNRTASGTWTAWAKQYNSASLDNIEIEGGSY